MPDTDPNAPATGDDETTEETTTDETTTPDPAKDADKPDAVKKALDAERTRAREARAKARDLEAQLAEAKTTIATLTTERDDAKSKLPDLEDGKATAESKLLRYEVLADAGLDLKLASRLTGSTREELETDASELAKLVGADPDFDGGPRGDTVPKNQKPEEAHRALLAGLFGAPVAD